MVLRLQRFMPLALPPESAPSPEDAAKFGFCCREYIVRISTWIRQLSLSATRIRVATATSTT